MLYIDKNYIEMFGSVERALTAAAEWRQLKKVVQIKGKLDSIPSETRQALSGCPSHALPPRRQPSRNPNNQHLPSSDEAIFRNLARAISPSSWQKTPHIVRCEVFLLCQHITA